MISEQDDHIPAPAGPAAKKGAAALTSRAALPAWGDRVLFAALGLLLGFAAAYLYLERSGRGGAVAAADPHAGLQGFQAGATRDLPGSGGGAPSISMNPALRQRITELENALSKDPGNGDLLVQLGNTAYDAEDWRLAADAYERALRVLGEDPNILTDLGVSYRSLGDFDKALAMFDRALKVEPGHWQATFNEIVVLGIDKGETAKARELLARLKASGQQLPALDQLEKTLEQRPAGR
ncbi:MAG TPA: tetratricopeptide repeat protein [Thermoanaerobaculia bacterium]|nr:tetratricopeptide repeat protein [Thermoanaerobaculia bacterium]